jgi:hypothetical protein
MASAWGVSCFIHSSRRGRSQLCDRRGAPGWSCPFSDHGGAPAGAAANSRDEIAMTTHRMARTLVPAKPGHQAALCQK